MFCNYGSKFYDGARVVTGKADEVYRSCVDYPLNEIIFNVICLDKR